MAAILANKTRLWSNALDLRGEARAMTGFGVSCAQHGRDFFGNDSDHVTRKGKRTWTAQLLGDPDELTEGVLYNGSDRDITFIVGSRVGYRMAQAVATAHNAPVPESGELSYTIDYVGSGNKLRRYNVYTPTPAATLTITHHSNITDYWLSHGTGVVGTGANANRLTVTITGDLPTEFWALIEPRAS